MRALALVWIMLVACGSHDEDRGRNAITAMKQLTAASNDLMTWFPKALTSLPAKITLDPAGGAKQLEVDILPKLDAYIATGERAVSAADDYLATGVSIDEQTRGQIDKMRHGNAAFHDLRTQLADIEHTLVRGNLTPADLDRISSGLTNAAIKMMAVSP